MNNHISNNNKFFNKHPFHLVEPSVLPFFLSFCALGLVFSSVSILHSSFPVLVYSKFFSFLLFLILTIFLMFVWWLNVFYESFAGFHNYRVRKGLKLGFALFILSEVMFFFGFFWAFFHNSLSPAVEIGAIWPPSGFVTFNPLSFPLLNTMILLLSGLTITITHYYVIIYDILLARKYFLKTLFLASFFMFVQFDEFYNAPFSISDGIFGSCFFMITGLHGFHVFVGALYILVCFLRFKVPNIKVDSTLENPYYFFKTRNSLAFDFSTWYWHFVDVVWLYVYVFLYIFSQQV